MGVIVVVVLALILLGFAGALVFSSSFRSDMIAGPGKISFLGLSVEGTVIVLLFCATLGAMVKVLPHTEQATSTAPAATATAFPPSVKIGDLPFTAASPEDALSKIDALWQKSRQPEINIADRVRALGYGDDESKIIRTFPRLYIGPWSLSAQAEETYLTVPSHIGPDQAYGCLSRLDKTYEVRMRSDKDDGTNTAKQTIKITNVITRDKDCDKKYDFVQVPCAVAEGVVPSGELSCGPDGVPKWNRESNKVPIWLTQVPGDD